MRLHVPGLLLTLAALGSLPESSGRAISSSTISTLELYDDSKTHHVRGFPFGIGGKPGGIKIGGGGFAAGPGKTPANIHGSKPRPIQIGVDRPPAGNPNGNQPGHTGPSDKKPSNDGSREPEKSKPKDEAPDKKPKSPEETDIRCRAEGCGSRKIPDDLTETEKKLWTKGGTGIDRLKNPTNTNPEWTQRIDQNYRVQPDGFHGLGDSIPALGLDKKFKSTDDWVTYRINSIDGDGFPVARMSFGRAKQRKENENKDNQDDDDNNLAIVGHERYRENDANRYVFMKDIGWAKDAEGKRMPNPEAEKKSVPVSQLVFEAAMRSGKWDNPKELHLISDIVENELAQKVVPAAHAAVGKKGQPAEFKKDATGEEGAQFKILLGLDNNYSYLNTVGFNREVFQGYELKSIKTLEANDDEGTDIAMSLLFERRGENLKTR
ncbi:hypothetical protein HJFPF1_10426 [Paramyrothecium foliicola]|nr:hypothetical protein HJFPF1_10426 [Paramyrothecium foliicola]